MSFNLLENVKQLISGDVVAKASALLGEDENGVKKAIAGILPSIMSVFSEKSADKNALSSIFSSAEEAYKSGILNNITNLFDNNNNEIATKGGSLIESLLGDNKSQSLIKLISKFSGIKDSSSKSLIGMITPIITGLLGKYAATNNMSMESMGSWLGSQKDGFLKAIPTDFNLGNIIGKINIDKIEQTVKNVEKGKRWVWPLLIILLLAIALWMFIGKGCKKEVTTVVDNLDTLNTEVAASDIIGQYNPETNEFDYNAGEIQSIDLPNDAGNLQVGSKSTEYKLYQFLSDPNSVLDAEKGNWFEFTNVKFQTGGSVITDESLKQLENMVAITKAFPNAQFRIGGYTDNTGDSVQNVKLSQQRAEAVMHKLLEMGVNKKSIESAKGYGPQWPIGDNSTDEGRAMNRRVAVNVKAK